MINIMKQQSGWLYFVFIKFNRCIIGRWTVDGNCKQTVRFMPFDQVMTSWISSRNFVVKIHSHITCMYLPATDISLLYK